MDDRRFIQALFAASVALVLLLSMLPAIAEAPPLILIQPMAKCADGKCTMDEADFKRLQVFHAQRLSALIQAGEIIDNLQAENAELMRIVTRFASGCERKRT